jgi:hypothetical protein
VNTGGIVSVRWQRGQSAVSPALRELTLSFWRQCGQAKRIGMAGGVQVAKRVPLPYHRS